MSIGRPIRVLEDGTRVYSNYEKYRPVPLEERKYRINKPDDPRAVRFGANWYLPLELVADEHREFPRTRPDSEGIEHRVMCKCDVCRDNPRVLALKQMRLGVKPGWKSPGSAVPRRRAPRPLGAGTAD